MSLEAEIVAQFAGSVEVEHHLDAFAKQIADEIRERTPLFGDRPPKREEPGIGEPGDLKASIQVSAIKSPGRRRVESRDPKVVWAELGAKHFPEIGMFAQVAALHGGTGPIIDAGIEHAQKHLRGEVEKLEKLTATGAHPASIAAQKVAVARARGQRSAAFKAARGGRRGRRR
ncbi:hypothetical protein KXD96_28000 (plasmid) [Mycobacterium sp. SMC-2]|uniref:hypothetical protein n=1 Tax=Mycobacterium sp. SMC-2 TaxID=2857058 RepID=UPI0021B4CA73|nr:hypothetical protein [Mycobacterium sp. SMC-2]UXA06584.1 hypothetical protein KXD96_27865 [Mycobacterium sp. SMC-2]UXA09674.1 hypothetical protein KXD96_28000 [Mycobacterium sp. SMC-2]